MQHLSNSRRELSNSRYHNYMLKIYPYLLTPRSSGVRSFQLESAEGLWSHRCTTARSNSHCHAGFQSREAAWSRPTGPTPTLSKTPVFMLLHVLCKAGKAAVVAAWQLWATKADSSGFREVRSLFSRNGQAAYSTDYRRRPGKSCTPSTLAPECWLLQLQVVGKAFTQAVRQEIRLSQEAAKARGNSSQNSAQQAETARWSKLVFNVENLFMLLTLLTNFSGWGWHLMKPSRYWILKRLAKKRLRRAMHIFLNAMTEQKEDLSTFSPK